jgi:hypothetical protein
LPIEYNSLLEIYSKFSAILLYSKYSAVLLNAKGRIAAAVRRERLFSNGSAEDKRKTTF